MIIARKYHHVTSVLTEDVKDTLARAIASVIYPHMRDLTLYREAFNEVKLMPNEWFSEFQSKCIKFIR